MATNFKNTEYSLVTGNQTLPKSATASGTIETIGVAVKGTGTKFKTEMPQGSWIVDLSQSEIRRVVRVQDDTLAWFSHPFTADIAASTALEVIHERDTNVAALSAKAVGGAIFIDGISLPEGESITFSKDSRDESAHRDLVDPIILDADGNSILALILR